MASMASVGQLVRAPKTAELIAGHLRGQIVRGELAAGDTLPPETDLMRQFGVSRPTLREAFRILETESLIQVRRGSRGGAQVTAPEPSVAARYVGLLLQMEGATVSDVYEARTAIESACARLLAQRRTDVAIAELRGLVADLSAAVEAGADPMQWSALAYRFHRTLMRESQNKTLAVQGGVLQDIVATHVATTVVRKYDDAVTPDRFRALVGTYAELVDLVEAGDAAGAEEHWRSHMEVSAKNLLDDVGSRTVVELFARASTNLIS
jgi:GntR family transcriptional regulator, transcriptional repressor for pyruvate dehydrogenase complex